MVKPTSPGTTTTITITIINITTNSRAGRGAMLRQLLLSQPEPLTLLLQPLSV
jgi:hypothetical protein